MTKIVDAPMSGPRLLALMTLVALDVVAVSKAARLRKDVLEEYLFRNGRLSADELVSALRVVRRAIHRRVQAAEAVLCVPPSEIRSVTASSISPERFEQAGFVAF